MQNNKEKKNVFEIENLSFAYDKHEVLNNLNLSFHEGIVTTMIGPNGCLIVSNAMLPSAFT